MRCCSICGRADSFIQTEIMRLDFDAMKSALSRLLQSPWLGAIILVAAGVLMAVVATDLGDRLPQLPSIHYAAASSQRQFPLAKIESLLARESLAQVRLATNGTHAFFTRFFELRPVPPAPAPTPALVLAQPEPTPSPTTRKAVLLYQGVYESATGQKKAFVKVERELHILTNGAKVIPDWAIADIGIRKLTLTNSSAQTNILEFNATKELEVPVK